MQNLPISRIVKVDVILTPLAAQAQDLKTLLVLGNSAVIDVFERIRTYETIDEVAADFGTTAPEYLAALLWFSQSPQPTQIKIGRWAKTATSAVLACKTLSAANQAIAAWQAIGNGGFTVSVDGAVQHVDGLNFGPSNNLNAVAAVIAGGLVGATCVYNATLQRFEITSTSTGAGSTLSFLTPSAGTDISAMMGGDAASAPAAYIADGIAPETAVAAVTIFDANYGQTWYAVTVPEADDDSQVAVGSYVEASNNKHLLGVSSQDTGILSAVVNNDIASRLKALHLKRSVVQYSSSSAYSVASLLGRILTTNYNGNNTVITLKFKQEPGIVGESLTPTQVDALEAKNANVFVEYNNDTTIIENGTVADGDFVDEIAGADWLAVTIMTAVYNLLYTSPTKIPQTDPGMHLIATTIAAVCSQGVTNGLLAPGIWNSQGFGILKQGDLLEGGFYVYAPPVANQLQADREARKSVAFQIAAKLAGAVHSADITIFINR